MTFDDDTDDEAENGDDNANGDAWGGIQMDNNNEPPSSNWGGAPEVTGEANAGGPSWD